MIISYDAADLAMNDEEARLLEEAYHRNSYHGKPIGALHQSELIKLSRQGVLHQVWMDQNQDQKV